MVSDKTGKEVEGRVGEREESMGVVRLDFSRQVGFLLLLEICYICSRWRRGSTPYYWTVKVPSGQACRVSTSISGWLG